MRLQCSNPDCETREEGSNAAFNANLVIGSDGEVEQDSISATRLKDLECCYCGDSPEEVPHE